MKLKIISKECEYNYELRYYRIKFLGEIFEVTKEDIHFIDIMQFWFEKKAGRSCFISFRKYPKSIKWFIISRFWNKLEWYWRKLYQYHRKNREKI